MQNLALVAVSGWSEQLPAIFSLQIWLLALWQWLALLTILGIAAPLSGVVSRALLALGERAAKLTQSQWDDALIGAAMAPLRFILLAGALAASTRLLAVAPHGRAALDLLARTTFILCGAWFLLRFLKVAVAHVERAVASDPDCPEGRLRALRTQLRVLRHILEVAVYVVAASLVLLQFEAVRSVGVSLLASAGIAGLVIGLAAQKSISSLLAGVQLSITQPMRIGDTVIIEKEWGWIEDITLTYVVVRVWDLRRLVVPISYFLDKPFQNWSKVAPEIMGTVELYADYRTDVDALRTELRRVLENDAGELWDRKVEGIQITDCTERTMVARVLVSSGDAGKNWDLRCLVREKLIAFLQRQPTGLPLLRAETAMSLPPAFQQPELFPQANVAVVAARPK